MRSITLALLLTFSVTATAGGPTIFERVFGDRPQVKAPVQKRMEPMAPPETTNIPNLDEVTAEELEAILNEIEPAAAEMEMPAGAAPEATQEVEEEPVYVDQVHPELLQKQEVVAPPVPVQKRTVDRYYEQCMDRVAYYEQLAQEAEYQEDRDYFAFKYEQWLDRCDK